MTTLTLDLAPIAEQLGLHLQQVEAVVELLDRGNTIPFITRYRKDQTGGLDEQQIQAIEEQVGRLRLLHQRRGTILRSIQSQGKLTPELQAQLENARTIRELEDLYLPYKPRKQSLATWARQCNLQPLAEEILNQDPLCQDLEARAADYADPHGPVPTAAEALLGAGYVLAEHFSEQANVRQQLREIVYRTGKLTSAKAAADEKVARNYKDFFDFSESIRTIPPHRVLALNRGERDKALRVKLEVDQAEMKQTMVRLVVPVGHRHAEFLTQCALDALDWFIFPSLEREVRRDLTDRAETHAVRVFAKNLRKLLLQPPVRNRRVLAIDPGLKRGAKLAALDEFGNLLEHEIIYLVGNRADPEKNATRVREMIDRHGLSVIAIGNGTGCREAELFVAQLIQAHYADQDVAYTIVNEAGTSVYSTSQVAREEFPELDATIRGAVSIGRRLLDPLSELVKIAPANIGVGLYQHDVKARHLRASLEAVVSSCVNYVGVDLNTASVSLLRYVSGLNQLTARRIYEYRCQHGPFRTREQLKDVPGVGEATFIQAAGFLRIADGTNPLDATWIHPESYDKAEQILARMGFSLEDLRNGESQRQVAQAAREADAEALAQECGIGQLLCRDILDQLSRPGRDPREALPPPIFKKNVLKLEDLAPGMELTGQVLNVVDFGVFVDIGVEDSGLVHISELSPEYVKDPHAVVSVGDVVQVWVMSVDTQRRRISLTMIDPARREELLRRHRPQRRPREKQKSGATSPDAGGRPAARSGGPRVARGKPRRGRPQRPRRARPARPAPPPPPLTEAMKQGKEPLHSFAQLKLLLEERWSEKEPDQQPQPPEAQENGPDSAPPPSA